MEDTEKTEPMHETSMNIHGNAWVCTIQLFPIRVWFHFCNMYLTIFTTFAGRFSFLRFPMVFYLCFPVVYVYKADGGSDRRPEIRTAIRTSSLGLFACGEVQRGSARAVSRATLNRGQGRGAWGPTNRRFKPRLAPATPLDRLGLALLDKFRLFSVGLRCVWRVLTI